jgi:hypothetical protein
MDAIEQTRARLARSRAEIFALAHELKGDAPRQSATDGFPRSHIMRALSGLGGKFVLLGAAVAVALLRPKVLWTILRLTPRLQPLLIRYLAHRFLR